ncbi:hypothetical protein DH2020_040645 [Rehmannia glutinosa]|uniref:Integrase zinc-binding domain-containing protein n=1 Tax=Rehmannia glutinosa TaxID=99300 RepID=A0ABR0USK2_REHGL
MRQRRLLELVKDYDCTIHYHPGKANVVVDGLSRKNTSELMSMIMEQEQLIKEFTNMKMDVREQTLEGNIRGFAKAPNGTLTYEGRVYVPKDDNLIREILEESHCTPYMVHPGGTKMYRDLRNIFWWRNMKGSIASFMERCMTCQQIKAEHQRSSGLLQPLEVQEW